MRIKNLKIENSWKARLFAVSSFRLVFANQIIKKGFRSNEDRAYDFFY